MTNVLIFSTIQGHSSLSTALHEYLEGKGLEVVTVTDEYPGAELFRLMYRYAPWLGQLSYELANLQVAQPMIEHFLHQRYDAFVRKNLEKYRPQVVLNVAFSYGPALSRWKKEFGYQFVNVIANPATFFHPELSLAADVNCVFDDDQAEFCKKLKPTAHVQPIGWLVRKAYEEKYEKVARKKELGLSLDSPVFLFVSGSEGQMKPIELLPKLIEAAQPVQIVMVCGSNKELYKRIESIVAQVPETCPVKILPLGYTTQLHQYMQAADLVVGKAGPNTLFEAVATRTPFFALSHIAGQESGNLPLVKKYGLGYAEEDFTEATKKILQLLANPDSLHDFDHSIAALAEHNRKAKDCVFEVIKKSIQ